MSTWGFPCLQGGCFAVPNTQNNYLNTTFQKIVMPRIYIVCSGYSTWYMDDISGCEVCQDSMARPCKQRSQGLTYICKWPVPGVSYPKTMSRFTLKATDWCTPKESLQVHYQVCTVDDQWTGSQVPQRTDLTKSVGNTPTFPSFTSQVVNLLESWGRVRMLNGNVSLLQGLSKELAINKDSFPFAATVSQ